jgi:hypothetical protein
MEHRLHDARHFYASVLIASGCDVVTVQRVTVPGRPLENSSTSRSGLLRTDCGRKPRNTF